MVLQHCYTTELIQFLVYPLIYVATPCFLGSISGLRNIQDNPSDLNTLRDGLFSLLFDNYRMWSAVLEYATDVAGEAGDAIMDSDAAVRNILSHLINTKTTGGVDGPTINIYLELPASLQLDEFFPSFIDAVYHITFDTPFMGKGRFSEGFNCANCRGINHPTGLCSFERISGWDTITRPARAEAENQAAVPTVAPTSARTQTPAPTFSPWMAPGAHRGAHTGPRLTTPSFHGTNGNPSGRS